MAISDILAIALAGGGLYVAKQATRRVSDLEKRVRDLEAGAKPVAQPVEQPTMAKTPKPGVAIPAPEGIRQPSTVPPPPEPPILAEPPSLSSPLLPREPSALGQLTDTAVQLVKRNPFAFLGVLLVLASVGFLFSWLAVHNVLPPAVRLTLVALVGLAVFGGSLRLKEERRALASNLQGGALAVQYLCVLWAYQGYELISSLVAFGALGVISAAAFGWAIARKEGLFAFMGLAGGLLTPVIASTGGGTFEGLVLYTLGVSLLSLGTALRMQTPTLAAASLGGVALLLASAARLPTTSAMMVANGLMLLVATYCATGLYWSLARRELSQNWLASVVSLLTCAPLAMDVFLFKKAGFSAKACAAMLAPVVAAYLVAYWFAVGRQIRVWLLVIAAALGIVGISIGLEGASQALALSVSALGLVTLAASTRSVWVERVAFAYWVLAAVASVATISESSRTPLLVAGLVALVAGYFAKESVIRGRAYAGVAPLLLCYATLGSVTAPPNDIALWFLGWAVVSTVAGRRLNWNELHLSAFWLLPAGFYLLVAALPHSTNALLVLREVTLLGWLAGSAYLVSNGMQMLARLEPKVTLQRGLVSLLLPGLASVEKVRLLWHFDAQVGVLLNALGLLWAVWALVARALRKSRPGEDYLVDKTGMLAGCLLLVSMLVGQPGAAAEVLKWLAVAVLVGVTRGGRDKREAGYLPYVLGLVAALAVGALLQLIGVAQGLLEPVINLVFERAMQPWVSLLWAGSAIAAVVYATRIQNRAVWSAGGVAILVLMAKMLLIDLATFSLVAKVLVFLVIGLGFIGLGFLSPRPPEKLPMESSDG